ncbi:MAG: hypothetical protein ACR2G6_05700, partial [Gemmatimonadaceae bacterium]
MTLVAGIFSRTARLRIPDEACNTLSRVISRMPDERVAVFRDDRVCIVKVDVKAFGEAAWFAGTDGSVTGVTGEPLIGPDPGVRNRAREAEILHQSLGKARWHELAMTRGVFSAASYHPEPARLAIATDRLGLRPMYVWIGNEFVAFSGQLRVLE